MTRREFITTATLLGYADEDEVRQYVRHSGKDNFTEDDYISLYRANPDRSDSPYYYRIDVVKALQVIDRLAPAPDSQEEYVQTAMLPAQTDDPDDPRVKKIVREMAWHQMTSFHGK